MINFREEKGSLTVEAAFIIPIFIFLLFCGVNNGITLLGETKEYVAVKEWQQKTVAKEVSYIRKTEALKRGIEILED